MPLELKEAVATRPYSVLLVDDKHELRLLLGRRLEQVGYLVALACTAARRDSSWNSSASTWCCSISTCPR